MGVFASSFLSPSLSFSLCARRRSVRSPLDRPRDSACLFLFPPKKPVSRVYLKKKEKRAIFTKHSTTGRRSRNRHRAFSLSFEGKMRSRSRPSFLGGNVTRIDACRSSPASRFIVHVTYARWVLWFSLKKKKKRGGTVLGEEKRRNEQKKHVPHHRSLGRASAYAPRGYNNNNNNV